METRAASIRTHLLAYGPQTAIQLANASGVSRPTISRALNQVPGLVRIGNGPSSTYALPNPVADLGYEWPLYLIDEQGSPEQVGTLTSLAPRTWHLEKISAGAWGSLSGEQFSNGLFPDLPWFLDDVKPQGFLGRAFAKKYGHLLKEGSNPVNWSSAAITEALLRYGGDLPGAFVLGREALREALKPQLPIAGEERALKYPALAAAVLEGDVWGSSAAGEQPKFTTTISSGRTAEAVIVKFSGPRINPANERWADLLAAEHLAGTALSEAGFPVAPSTIVDAGDRRFLEIKRFDRTPHGGRIPVVSLRAIDAAFIGSGSGHWSAVADDLLREDWINETDASTLTALGRFGTMISNSDMHYGNVSFILNREKPLQLAPSYDMLPMSLRPNVEGDVPMEAPLDLGPSITIDARVKSLAKEFWNRVSESPLVTAGFQQIAMHQSKKLGP